MRSNKGKKSRHSKIRNTGIIFECLLRQVTADVIAGVKSSSALKILKTNFHESTELGKEVLLYNTLLNEKFNSDKKASYLIEQTLNEYKNLNKQNLKREKYNVIKSISENYKVAEFLSSQISEYKTYASIYKLFELSDDMNPEEKTETYFNILENITTTTDKEIQLSNLKSGKDLKEDEDLRVLTYKVLLEKFNSKYTNLDSNQRKLLRKYINNISNTNSLKEHIQDSLPSLKSNLTKYKKNVKDKVVKIKLNEAIKSVDKLCEIKTNNVKDKVVITMLRYYQLLSELKKK